MSDYLLMNFTITRHYAVRFTFRNARNGAIDDVIHQRRDLKGIQPAEAPGLTYRADLSSQQPLRDFV